MEIAVILVFFGLVISFGLCLGFKNRSKRENVFYIFSIIVSLTALLMKSLGYELFS